MIIYNNNAWGPEVTIEEEEVKSYEEIIKDIHARRVKVLRHDDDNSKIIYKSE